MARLSDLGLTLGDIDLGSGDAESDRRLSDYFVKTPYVDSALSIKRSHFLGSKGSGKSALFSQLDRLFIETGHETLIVRKMTPDQYAWNALRQYKEQGLSSEQAHTNAWKFSIAIEAAGSLAVMHDESISSESAREARQLLASFIHQNYGNADPTLISTATHLLKGIKSFNLEAFGFGVGFEQHDREQPLTPLVIESLLETISVVTSEIGLVVTFDKLDDSWDGSEESKFVLIGLLKAAKEINDKYARGVPPSGLSIIVFLRTDIYEGLRFDDKDKHRALEQHIVWNADLLRTMINERLTAGLKVDDLFEPGEMRGSILPFNYIVKRTFLRPREVIQFLNECIHRAGEESTEIKKDQVREAEERYSYWKVDDIKQEYRRLYPEFENLIEALRQGTHRYDSLDEFEDFLRSRCRSKSRSSESKGWLDCSSMRRSSGCDWAARVNLDFVAKTVTWSYQRQGQCTYIRVYIVV